MESTELEEFDTSTITDIPRVIWVGRSNTGKTVACAYWLMKLAQEKKLDALIVFSATAFNGFWQKITNTVIQGWDPQLMEGIMKKREEMISKGQKVNNLGVVLDDLIDSAFIDLKRDHIVNMQYTKGRHYKISTFVITQKLKMISTSIRSNTEYACVLSTFNQLEKQAVAEEFSHDKDQFFKLYDEYVHSYQFLVFDNSGYESKLFVDKADLKEVEAYDFKRFHRKIEKPKAPPSAQPKKPEDEEPKSKQFKGITEATNLVAISREGFDLTNAFDRNKKNKSARFYFHRLR